MTSTSPSSAHSENAANSEYVLHRLRTDVPAQDVLADPPPVPDFDGPFRLRIADAQKNSSSDANLVAEWMARPHLVETWEQAWEPEKWRDEWTAKLATTYALPLILSYQEQGEWKDVGYVEIYRPHRDEIAHTYQSQAHDLGFHIAIGEPDLTGKGLFSPFMKELAEKLLAADPECDLVIVEPDYRNAQMHRALSKVDWVDVGERQQRADRRVRLFFYPAAGVDAAVRGQQQS